MSPSKSSLPSFFHLQKWFFHPLDAPLHWLSGQVVFGQFVLGPPGAGKSSRHLWGRRMFHLWRKAIPKKTTSGKRKTKEKELWFLDVFVWFGWAKKHEINRRSCGFSMSLWMELYIICNIIFCEAKPPNGLLAMPGPPIAPACSSFWERPAAASDGDPRGFKELLLS